MQHGILVRAECVRCPWLLAQTKVATILGIFGPSGVRRPPFSLGTWGHCPQVISKLAGDFEEISFIFMFFVFSSLFCHLSEENVQIITLLKY